MHETVQIVAGDENEQEFYEMGDYFRLMSASYPVTVTFYASGKEIAKAENVGAGYAEEFISGNFDRFKIKTSTSQDVQIATRLGARVHYDTPPVGNVFLTNINGEFSQAAHTVTDTAAELLPAKPTRRYLMIQNNDDAGDIYVMLSSASLSISSGIKLSAGNALEIQGFAPVGQIQAIGNIASNPNVIVVEA